MDGINVLYREFSDVGKTAEFDNAYEVFSKNRDENEVFMTLAEAVSAEAARAFKAGFDVAVSLLTSGGTA